MNNNYEVQPIAPVTINGITFTQADFVCLARKLQEYVRIVHFGEPIKDAFLASCCNCPYAIRGEKNECAHLTAIMQLTKLTGTYFSFWEGKDGGMSGLPDEYKKPKE